MREFQIIIVTQVTSADSNIVNIYVHVIVVADGLSSVEFSAEHHNILYYYIIQSGETLYIL